MRSKSKSKPPLKLVEHTVIGDYPPRPLGLHGQNLWNRVLSEHDLSDVAGREFLANACAALDRAESLREQINRDGEVISTRQGFRDHPGLKHELASRFLCQNVAEIRSRRGTAATGAGAPAGAAMAA